MGREECRHARRAQISGQTGQGRPEVRCLYALGGGQDADRQRLLQDHTERRRDQPRRLVRGVGGGAEEIGRAKARQAARAGSTDASSFRARSNISSVVPQSTHGSVTETPYLRSLSFAGIGWLPGKRFDSTIRPTIERLPSWIWCEQSWKTSGWSAWSLSAFACEQSTTIFAGSLASASARSASRTLTVS